MALCITDWGTSIGPIAWFVMLSVTGLILIFLLPCLPRLVVSLGVLAPLLSLIGIYSPWFNNTSVLIRAIFLTPETEYSYRIGVFGTEQVRMPS